MWLQSIIVCLTFCLQSYHKHISYYLPYRAHYQFNPISCEKHCGGSTSLLAEIGVL